MADFHDVEGPHQVRVGTKVEIWDGARAAGWGEVTRLLPERQVMIRRLDEDETYRCDAAAAGGVIFVDDWSAEVRELMAERRRQLWQPAGVESWDLAGGGEVRVGTKVEIADECGPDDWGEVTRLLAGRRVAVYWYGDEDTSIADVDEGSDLYVGDWSAEVYDLLRERARGADGLAPGWARPGGADHGQA